jgi:hypothetical protein
VCCCSRVSDVSNLGNTEAALGPAALLEAAQYSHNRDVYLEPRKDLHSTELCIELASRNYSAVFDIIVDTGDAFFGCEIGALGGVYTVPSRSRSRSESRLNRRRWPGFLSTSVTPGLYSDCI